MGKFADYEDLCQEVRFYLDRGLPCAKEFASVLEFYRYVKRLARWRYIDGIRKAPQDSESDGTWVELDAEDAAEALFADERQSAALEQVIHTDLFAKLLVCLSSEDVDILLAYHFDGHTYEEIGEMFGIGPRQKVQRRMVRILARVLKQYERITASQPEPAERKRATGARSG
ncbi:MAG TPA: sigma-70 family RNA polymerase sigma factor [Blastocatellia bacterium]|nr:sigma-70 family RNA polymerase sigma factor [Blastocatellia bacterium]